LAATGDLDGAQLTLQYALEGGRVELGEDDPAVLATAHQLATVHRQAGDASAARRVLEEAFAAGQWRLGDADPLMLSISFDLGVVAEELGNRHEARRAFGRVAGLGPGVLGDDHWAVRQARDYLGDDPPTMRMELPAPPTPPAADAAAPAPANTAPYTDGAGQAITAAYTDGAGRAITAADTDGAVTATGSGSYPAPIPRAAPTEMTPMGVAPADMTPADTTPADMTPADMTPADMTPATQAAPAPRATADTAATTVATGVGAPGWDEPAPSPAGAVAVYFPERVPDSRGRGPAMFAAVAAAVAALIAIAALVLVLTAPDEVVPADGGGGDRPEAPTLGGGQPPRDVKLRDVGSTVELTWADPTAGTVSFMVTGGHPGELLKPMGQLGPGQTSLKLYGLNAGLDYCFAVVAVYSASKFNPSPPVCTNRARATPRAPRRT
jgi:hypothetical protein